MKSQHSRVSGAAARGDIDRLSCAEEGGGGGGGRGGTLSDEVLDNKVIVYLSEGKIEEDARERERLY